MYFSTCDHYLSDINDLNDTSDITNYNDFVEYNVCFICLEIKHYYDDEYCINLHNENYIKNCLCNGWIHTSCLHIWYTINKNCPFCLSKMIKKIENNDNIFLFEKIHIVFQFIRFYFYFIILVWFYYKLLLFCLLVIHKVL
jgi:hypothetical protein